MKVCECGTEVKADAKFCLSCGHRFDGSPVASVDAEPLPKSCAGCGTLLEQGTKFCAQCGAAQPME